MPSFSWKTFENAVTTSALAAASRVMDKHAQSFYAVVFHEFYAETHEVIAMPCLAANTLEALGDEEDARWNSADWRWTQLRYEDQETKKLHRELEKNAASRDEEHWNEIHGRFIKAFINVAKALQEKLKTHKQAHKDFGVFVFANDDEIEVIQECTTPAQFRKLFPGLQAEIAGRQKLAKSPLDSKLETYRHDLFEFQSQVLELGARAVPMLLNALEDGEQAWMAADLLGELGIADKGVVEALRKRARKGAETNFHDTIALALLGDIDFLLELADTPKTKIVAIRGISGLYSVSANECRREILLDYRPMEKLLEKPACKRQVEKLFSGHCQIGETEIDEALRGLESKHALIREHAVCTLGDRRLGKKASERILPGLAARLQDRNANVRRLAILALSDWKKTAKPYVEQVRKLFKDPNGDVSFTAKHYLKDLG